MEAEENMHAGLEVANFRALEIQHQYDLSFMEKKNAALNELAQLQGRLQQYNIESVQADLIEKIEQSLASS